MPLAAHYIGWAFNNLAKETKKDPLQSYEPLSRTEETRLVRALYRFQLYCNLFGVSHYRFRCQWMLEFDHVNILRIYLGNYEPWEVEEIACIYAFTKATFNQVFDDIRWDVHQDNPRFEEHRPPTPQGAFNLDSGYTRDFLLEGTLSRGLVLLHDVLFKIKDHTQLVSTMQEQISRARSDSLEDILDNTSQSRRRPTTPHGPRLEAKTT